MSPHRWMAVVAVAWTALGCRSFFVDMTVPTISEISATGFEKTDVEFMGAALPGSLLQLEGFLTISPDNADLMMLVAEAKCGYAMGWVEDERPDQASVYYLEGKDLALKALYQTHGDYRDAIDTGATIAEAVKTVKDPEFVKPLFQAGQCWGSWLNLNLTNPRAYFAQPHVVALMNQVLELDPDYFHGGAYIFFGAYYSSIPTLAGGGIEKGRTYFDKAFAISEGKSLMVHYQFANTYARILKDIPDPVSGKTGEELFDEMLRTIRETPADALPDMGLANAIAKKKAKLLASKRNEWF